MALDERVPPSAMASPLAGGRFKLLRRLSIAILLALIATAVALVLLYRYDQLEEHSAAAAQENERTARYLSSLWAGHLARFIEQTEGLDAAALRTHPDIALLDRQIAEHLDATTLKVKLYNLAGRVAYSSVHDEIGGGSRNRDMVESVLRGETRHKQEFRASFRTYGGELSDRHIIQTYLPLRQADRIIGAFEAYADITPMIARMQTRLVHIAFIVTAAFAALYAALFFAVRRADHALATWHDDLAASARQIAIGEARLRAMLDTAIDGVIGIDADDRLIEFNPAAEAIFGWQRDEVIGRPMADLLVPPQHRLAHRDGMKRFMATREPRVMNRRIEITALRRNGTEFPVELSDRKSVV